MIKTNNLANCSSNNMHKLININSRIN